ncbi:FAD-linked oxidoreductase-like protein [Podospora conica]|nr:FAD-linked oxidoreductase-like protein [Schizothecium conicum]
MALTAEDIEALRASGKYPTEEQLKEIYRHSRLNLPTPVRLPLTAGIAFLVGLSLGTAQGSRMAGMRFRAEHAHKLPDTTTGWYLYHKSKNYHSALGGLIEGAKMGARVAFWTTTMFAIENMFDKYRGTADILNTVTSCVAVAGGFSLWNRFSLPMAARTTKTAMAVGFVYGGLQDAVRRREHRDPFHSDTRQAREKIGPPDAQPEDMAKPAPLAILPLTNILRSLMTTTVSSSPLLLPPSLAVMSILANTTNPLLNPDRNPLLRFFLKHTFYAQFCAGENPAEVRHTISSLKQIGFSGVILGYAKEVVLPASSSTPTSTTTPTENTATEVRPWATGTLETVRLASPGDFVALKFTGAGQHALHMLTHRLPPSATLAGYIDSICALAAARGVRLLFDAEQHAVQPGIDDWTMTYMRKYNTTPGKAVVYGTYQAYLKSCAATLSAHLAAARAEGFTLGVKLVRGAYMGSDPREIFHGSKAETDAAYDGIVEALVRREWRAPLSGGEAAEGFPDVNLVVASHNAESVRKARAVLEEVGGRTETAFAQLQGMADEVSCELVAGGGGGGGGKTGDAGAYKYLVWGSTGECMKYLLRRAQENKDAVQRTRSGRDAMRGELVRRVKSLFGFI